MTRFRQRCHAVWGSAQAQDIAEYLVILAVIFLLVIGTVKMIGKRHGGGTAGPTPAGATR